MHFWLKSFKTCISTGSTSHCMVWHQVQWSQELIHPSHQAEEKQGGMTKKGKLFAISQLLLL